MTAEPSGNEHLFKFTLTADLPARPQELRSIVTGVTGDLYTPGAEHRIVLGRLHGVRDATVVETQPRERALQFWLRALVARRQLESVEHFRAGSDVMLGLELRVTSFAMLSVPIPYAAKPTDVAAYPAIASEEVLHPAPPEIVDVGVPVKKIEAPPIARSRMEFEQFARELVAAGAVA